MPPAPLGVGLSGGVAGGRVLKDLRQPRPAAKSPHVPEVTAAQGRRGQRGPGLRGGWWGRRRGLAPPQQPRNRDSLPRHPWACGVAVPVGPGCPWPCPGGAGAARPAEQVQARGRHTTSPACSWAAGPVLGVLGGVVTHHILGDGWCRLGRILWLSKQAGTLSAKGRTRGLGPRIPRPTGAGGGVSMSRPVQQLPTGDMGQAPQQLPAERRGGAQGLWGAPSCPSAPRLLPARGLGTSGGCSPFMSRAPSL